MTADDGEPGEGCMKETELELLRAIGNDLVRVRGDEGEELLRRVDGGLAPIGDWDDYDALHVAGLVAIDKRRKAAVLTKKGYQTLVIKQREDAARSSSPRPPE